MKSDVFFLCVFCVCYVCLEHRKAFRNSGLRTLRRTPEGTTLQGLRTTSARRAKERSTSAPWTSDICHICIYVSDSAQYLLPNRFDGFDSVWLGLTRFDSVWLSWFKLNQLSTETDTDQNRLEQHWCQCVLERLSLPVTVISQYADSWLLPSHASRASPFPPKFRLYWLRCQVSWGVQAL